MIELQIAHQAIEYALKPVSDIDSQVDADPINWISECFFIPELSGPMKLFPSQSEPLREALRRDQFNNFIYSTVLWSAIKKSAKSSIAAAVALWFAFRRDYALDKIIANDLKQAESRVYYYVRRCLELNDKLGGPLKGRSAITNYKITLDNGATIEAIPIDPKGEAGGNDDFVCYSEIWGWKTRAALQMWTESTLSPLKYGQSMRWAETYAGSIGDSPVLEGMHQTGVTDGEQPDDRWREYEMYRNIPARQFTLWTTRPSLPWQTEAYYDQERATLDPGEFDRVHRNQWSAFAGRIYPTFDPIWNITEEAAWHQAKGVTYWGGDDGYAYGKGPGTESYHPRAFLMVQHNHLGGLDVFYEYEKAGVHDQHTTINELLETGYPKPDLACIDSASPMLIATLFNDYDINAVGATHEISEGIKIVRQMLLNAAGVRTIRVHPSCKRLIHCLRNYRYSDTGVSKGGEVKPLKIDDHLPDCLRYLCWLLSAK